MSSNNTSNTANTGQRRNSAQTTAALTVSAGAWAKQEDPVRGDQVAREDTFGVGQLQNERPYSSMLAINGSMEFVVP